MRGAPILLQFFLVIISSTYINLSAQTISVCPPQQLDLETSLQSQLASCGNNSYITVIASDIPQVPIGNYSGPTTINADGILTVEIYNSAGNLCNTYPLTIDLIETQFTYSITGCHVLNITGPDNGSGCNYSYLINGTTYNTQNPSGIQLPNGGLYPIEVTASCGGCVQNESYTINTGVPEAALSFNTSETFYFDPDFNSWVVCTGVSDAEIEISDISQGISSGSNYNLEIISPSGVVINLTSEPISFILVLGEEGLYVLNYTIVSGGCTSDISYQIFKTDPNVATQLNVAINADPFYCVGDIYEITLCAADCSDNPPGTLYSVDFPCSNYFFQTDVIPYTFAVPLSAPSCSDNCITGDCACDITITAKRPCVIPQSGTYCVKVSPDPEASFNLVPTNPQDTYCIGENISFNSDWDEIDCNGITPLPSICENQDPLFTISPAIGWTIQSGALDSDQVQISFDTPGTYEVCYSAENSCGLTDQECEVICILENTPPTVDWLNTTVVCVGDVINPEIDFTTVACAITNIDWSSSDPEVSISDSGLDIPSIVFTAPGDFDLDVSVSGLCNPFSDSAPFTVCDAPGINLVQPVVTLCLFEPYCFGDLISVVWNNCPGDVVWSIPGATGSPFTNPAPNDLCISWDTPQTVTIDVVATNDCGPTTQSITVNIETSPACPIDDPGEFCIGDEIDIAIPTGGAAPTWYFSTDGTNFNPVVGGMPQTPTQSTWYYVESSVNGCFCISDTVQAILVPEPVFTFEVSDENPCPGEEVTFFLNPAQGNVNWYDAGGTLLATQPEYAITPTGPTTITGELIYGPGAVQCTTSGTMTTTPVLNPIVLDCSSIPATWCDGDPAQPLPTASPVGGNFYITDGNMVVDPAPTDIDPTVLGIGSYYVVYEFTTSTPSICTFLDSCQFTITTPQIPVFAPTFDTVCYNGFAPIQEMTGLSGQWSTNCAGIIPPSSGFFSPEMLGCTPGTTIEIYYTGDCLVNDTLEFYVIPIENFSISASNLNPCFGEEVNFSTLPAQTNIEWQDQNGNTLGSGANLDLIITDAIDVTAISSFGTNFSPCSSSQTVSINPVPNPIVLDCSTIPSNWCAGDPAQPLPPALPAGGSFYITDGNVVVDAAPANIDPTALGVGSFYVVYEFTTTTPSVCTFLDSCQFTITTPQTPVITPSVDTLCYYSEVNFQETSGLSGTWSSNCPGAIDASGLFTPQAAGCSQGTVVEVYYTGDCIENDTTEIYLIPLEVFTLNASNLNPCNGEMVSFTTNPIQSNVAWQDQDGNVLGTDPNLDLVIDGPIDVTAISTYGTQSVVCSENLTISINPVPNPIILDCTSIPSNLCAGDPSLSFPSAAPSGGNFYITDGTDVVDAAPTNIDPTTLGVGSFYLVYQFTTTTPSVCTFLDSCQFTISTPQVPVITPTVDTLCYYSEVTFQETSGLSGAWSSNCSGAIDAGGLFTPQAAGCPEGSVVEVYYTGDCIENDTIEIYLIPTPVFSINASNPEPCPGDIVTFSVSPPQSQLSWFDANGIPIGTSQTIDLIITESTSISVESIYGTPNTTCTVSESYSISPEPDPISINCPSWPVPWCEGDPAMALPASTPLGGTFSISNGTSTILPNPTSIDPGVLSAGSYFLVYEVNGIGSSGCTFMDSCAFEILSPENPNIQPTPDQVCFNTSVQFADLSNLGGLFSSNCTGIISPSGFFNPSNSSCTPGTSVEIYYTGDCILNDTLEIFLIPVPTVNIDIPQTEICANECVTMNANILGNFDNAEWTLSWGSETITLAIGESFCPDQNGINSSVAVTAELVVSTLSSPVCTVIETHLFQIIRIPEEDFVLESPQCIAENIALPGCNECDSYDIVFTNSANQNFDCVFPGAACNLPDTGMYNYEVIYDFGQCLSDPFTGSFHQIDMPFLEVLSLEYDSCAPVAEYNLTYGHYGLDLIWESNGDFISTNEIAADTFRTIINHNTNIEVDTSYVDEITISNMCGTVTDSRSVYHMALPDFTIDPDSVAYCDNAIVPLELGFAQPLHLDSILIEYTYQGNEQILLYDFPDAPLTFQFESFNDTLVVVFNVTAFNPCGEVSKQVTSFILPTDVSADLDIQATSPVCPGDTIPLDINSTGNINLELRSITVNNPFIEPIEILGNWYLIPLEGIADGIYTVQLTEFGFCGSNAAVETIHIGPSLNASFIAADVCDGGPVTFVPTISNEASLTWEFQPDTFSYEDFPPPYLYQNVGIYFPTLLAENPDYCPSVFSAPVQVYDGVLPQVICDASCDGSVGCSVDFSDEYICVQVDNASNFISYQWNVNGQFYPEYGPEIRIPIDLIRPCVDNIVTLKTIDNNGCESTMNRRIDFNDALIHIPNSFTPNQDGINDVFKPVILGKPTAYSFAIFDRWGKKVFETKDKNTAWLGNSQNDGYYLESDVYTYILQWKPCNRAEDKMKEITGHVTLVR